MLAGAGRLPLGQQDGCQLGGHTTASMWPVSGCPLCQGLKPRLYDLARCCRSQSLAQEGGRGAILPWNSLFGLELGAPAPHGTEEHKLL